MSSPTSSRAIGPDVPLGGELEESGVCNRSLRMRGPNCSFPKDKVCSEPSSSFVEDAATADSSVVESPSRDEVLSVVDSKVRAPSVACGRTLPGVEARSELMNDLSGTSEVANPAVTAAVARAPALTSEEEGTIQEEGTRIKKPTQFELAGKKTSRGRSKRRSLRGKSKKDRVSAAIVEEAPDAFDEWVGRKLKAWRDEEAVEPGGGLPPLESGITEEIDFEPSKDEIDLPTSLSALQRRQVHGWAMQLALFHASSGDDAQRHVIVSKTGVFQGKLLTRGGRSWYKEGVTAPDVERFALQPGYEEEAQPLVDALLNFYESMQQRESGFAKWLAVHAPGPLNGSDLPRARESIRGWPLLQDVEWDLVETPEKLASLVTMLDSCKEFGFDLEAHNARTYHGLTCLLQLSTESKDFIVDPLAEGMWESMTLLRGPFANPDILKIGHSIRSCDVPSLFRDFGIVIVNAIDTEESVHALGDKHTGLAKVLENSGVKELHDMAGLKQTMQTCDWRERPLSAEKLMYARCDSHFLLPLWRLLRARLLGADTFANRDESKKEEEVVALDEGGRQYNDYDDNGGRMETPENEGAGARASGSQGAWVDPAQGDTQRLERAVGPASPVPIAEELWVADWENPEHCHRRERSRSGSFFRSNLGSIKESTTEWATDGGDGSVTGSNHGRKTFRLEESEISAAFLEGYNQEEMDQGGIGVGGSTSRDVGSLLPFDLGENFVGDDEEPEDEGEEVEEDEDEDLWDGWGYDTPGVEGGGGETAAAAIGEDNNLQEKKAEVASVSPEIISTSATALQEPPETAVFDREVPSLSMKSSTVSSIEASIGDSRGVGKKCKRKKALKIAALPNGEHILHTDGIRLMWKAFYRTQLAAVVLWHPSLEAKRQDSHNERYFRTAMQRLKPPRWSEVNIRVYEDIYLWRDRTARRMDDGVSYVCPGDILIDIALALPKTLDELRRVSVPLSPVLGEADTPEAEELARVVRVALGLPEDPEQKPSEGKEECRSSGAANESGKGCASVGGE